MLFYNIEFTLHTFHLIGLNPLRKRTLFLMLWSWINYLALLIQVVLEIMMLQGKKIDIFEFIDIIMVLTKTGFVSIYFLHNY